MNELQNENVLDRPLIKKKKKKRLKLTLFFFDKIEVALK
jgi:hypothetical protein